MAAMDTVCVKNMQGLGSGMLAGRYPKAPHQAICGEVETHLLTLSCNKGKANSSRTCDLLQQVVDILLGRGQRRLVVHRILHHTLQYMCDTL